VVEAAGDGFEALTPGRRSEVEIISMLVHDHAYMDVKMRRSKRSRRRPRIVDGQRAAAVRAFTGARLLAQGQVSSLRKAARACGSNPQYVAAAQTVLAAEDTLLIENVLNGDVGLLYAGSACRRVSDLVRAYRQACSSERAYFGRTVGVGEPSL
jgi:hypothetical protein